MFEKQSYKRERGREFFYRLFYSPTGQQSFELSQVEIRSLAHYPDIKWMTRVQALEPSSGAFPNTLSGTWVSIAAAELKVALIMDAGVISDGLTCYASTPTPLEDPSYPVPLSTCSVPSDLVFLLLLQRLGWDIGRRGRDLQDSRM